MRSRPLVLAGFLMICLASVLVTDGAARTQQQQTHLATLRVLTPGVSSKSKLPIVKVGHIASITSPSNNLKGGASVMVAGVRALNRAGGLHGHQVGLVICDDHNDGPTTADCARQMVSQGVVAILGGQSTFDSQSQPILQAAGIPMIGVNAIAPQVTNGTNVYLFNVSNPVLAEAGAAWAWAHQERPVAGVIADSSAGRVFADTINTEIKKFTNGAGYQPEVFVAPTTADFSPIGAAVASGSSGSAVMSIGGANGLASVRAIAQLAGSVKHVYFSGSYPVQAWKDGLGSVLDKVISIQTYPPFTDPLMASFAKDMAAEQKRGDNDVTLDNLAPRDANGWVALKALVAVTKGVPNITAATVTAALNKAKNLNVGPFLPPWTPNTTAADGSRAGNTSVWAVGFKDQKPYLLSKKPISLANLEAGKLT